MTSKNTSDTNQAQVLNKTDVSKSAFSKLLKKLEFGSSKYETALGAMESLFSEYVEFDFSIRDIVGDGFVLLDSENAKVADIKTCFEIIKKKGKLTQEDLAIISF